MFSTRLVPSGHRPVLVLLLAALLLGVAGLGLWGRHAGDPAQELAPDDPDLLALPGVNWLSSGGNLYNERYSLLDQITTRNVGSLTGAWEAHLHSGLGSKWMIGQISVRARGVPPPAGTLIEHPA